MQQSRSSYPRPLRNALLLGVSCAAIAACSSSPFEERTLDELRASVVESVQRELRPLGDKPAWKTPVGSASATSFLDERLDELNAMGGPTSYEHPDPVLSVDIEEDLTDEELKSLRGAEAELFKFGENLLGEPTSTFRLSLQQAITSAVSNNLDVQSARLDPAISEAQVANAESVFDWVFFGSYDFARTDQVQATPIVGGVPVGEIGRASCRERV